jgi:hypothetical protein
MKKEFYSFEQMFEYLKENNSAIVSIYGYGEYNKIYNLYHNRGKFADKKGFNLMSNFTNYKVGLAIVKKMFKECGCMTCSVVDFSDKRMQDAFNYNNFLRMKL